MDKARLIELATRFYKLNPSTRHRRNSPTVSIAVTPADRDLIVAALKKVVAEGGKK